LVARDETSFGEALTRILEHPRIAKALSAEARKHVERNWTWEAAGERIGHHLSALAQCDQQTVKTA
jgi:glycosyltransferase involved in cell wall biosynthesis